MSDNATKHRRRVLQEAAVEVCGLCADGRAHGHDPNPALHEGTWWHLFLIGNGRNECAAGKIWSMIYERPQLDQGVAAQPSSAASETVTLKIPVQLIHEWYTGATQENIDRAMNDPSTLEAMQDMAAQELAAFLASARQAPAPLTGIASAATAQPMSARSEALEWLYAQHCRYTQQNPLCTIEQFGPLQANHTAYETAEILVEYTAHREAPLLERIAAQDELLAANVRGAENMGAALSAAIEEAEAAEASLAALQAGIPEKVQQAVKELIAAGYKWCGWYPVVADEGASKMIAILTRIFGEK